MNYWCFWTVVLEKTLESPLDCKEIKPVNSKGNQSWIFIGRTDAEAETPIFWPADTKNWLLRRLSCQEKLKAGGEGDDRRWDGWMASPTRCTWVWASSGSWWWIGKPGVLQSMESVTKSWTWLSHWTKLNWVIWEALSHHMYIYPLVFRFFSHIGWAFLVAQLIKNLSAMWESWVQTLGWEDPLEKG